MLFFFPNANAISVRFGHATPTAQKNADTKKKILYVPANPKNPVMIPTMNHVFSFLYLCCYQQLIYYPSGLTV